MAWAQAGNIRGPQGAQGIQGEQGPQGEAAPAGLDFVGDWDDAVAYNHLDVVAWGGSSYYALDPEPALGTPPTGTALDPGSDDADVNAGWALLAIQGAQGIQGVQGEQGEQGPAGAQGIQGVAGNQGIQGIQGVQGEQGTAGDAGPRGSKWFTGEGAPGAIGGSLPDDQYLDVLTGDVYTLS